MSFGEGHKPQEQTTVVAITRLDLGKHRPKKFSMMLV
jgi:hypothetical protein